MNNRHKIRIEIGVNQCDNGYAVRFRLSRGYDTQAEQDTVHETLDGALQTIRKAVLSAENALLLPSGTEEK